jgi:arginine deiminase
MSHAADKENERLRQLLNNQAIDILLAKDLASKNAKEAANIKQQFNRLKEAAKKYIEADNALAENMKNNDGEVDSALFSKFNEARVTLERLLR